LVEFSITTKPMQQFMERSTKEISSEARSEMDRESSAPKLSQASSRDRLIANYP
jgi:hypothetical protein